MATLSIKNPPDNLYEKLKARKSPHGRTRADLSEIPSFGVYARRYAITLQMQIVHSDHNRLDERSLAMHRPVTAKVQADPALLDDARENARRWQASDGRPKLALAEWEHILEGPVSQITQFIAERSERATRLRQSSWLAGILTEAERRTIYETYGTLYNQGGRIGCD